MDRLYLRFILLILAGFALLWARPVCASWHVEGDACDPAARGNSWSREAKQRTRDRIWSACKAVGGSDVYCKFWDAVVVRESWGGVASAVHTLGTDADGVPEYGLGPLGLSVRWHGGKWPGEDEDPAFCSPEVSFVIGHAIAVSAVEKYGARHAVDIQAIYGGGPGFVRCVETGAPRWWRHVPGLRALAAWLGHGRECRANPTSRTVRSICSRMGPECWTPLTREDLGDAIPLGSRRAWAAAQARR